jgi:hypothetical protein
MGLFSKRDSDAPSANARVTLPPNLVARLEPFGRFEFDPQGSGVDAVGLPNAEFPLLQMAKQNPDGFVAALAATTVPVGGWTAYGAMRLVMHFGLVQSDAPHADSDAISMAALQFLRDSGYSWDRLSLNERSVWQRAAGQEW